MFSGIIAAVGTVAGAKRTPGGVRISVDSGALDLRGVKIGDSIAINGTCLTVVARIGRRLAFDVSAETLACTIGFDAGSAVNLERALRLSDRLDGHIVSGHVDAVGVVKSVRKAGGSRVIAFAVPRSLAKYIARKGSVAVNGVSLTINAVKGNVFEVNVIPHTLKATNLGLLTAGAKVNLEADMLARYAERLAHAR
jgi:riboflavin synthase